MDDRDDKIEDDETIYDDGDDDLYREWMREWERQVMDELQREIWRYERWRRTN